MLNNCPASKSHKRRVGWIVKSSQTGSVNFIGNPAWIKALLSLTTVERIRPFQTWQTFNLFSYPQTLRQFVSQWIKVSLEALKRITEGGFCVCYTEPWRKTNLIKRFQFYKRWGRHLLILGRLWPKETVVNCFKKAGTNPDVQEAVIADWDDPFKDPQENLNELKSADPPMVTDDVPAESIVRLDYVITTASQKFNGEIIRSKQRKALKIKS